MVIEAATENEALKVRILKQVDVGRVDTNHRYVTDLSIRDQMVALGWIKEGDGPDAVAFCASWY